MKPEPFTSRLFSIGAFLGGTGFFLLIAWSVISTFKLPFLSLYNQFGGFLGASLILMAFVCAFTDSILYRHKMRKYQPLMNYVPNTKFVNGRFTTVTDAEATDDRTWNEQANELNNEVDSPLFIEWCKLPAKSSE